MQAVLNTQELELFGFFLDVGFYWTVFSRIRSNWFFSDNWTSGRFDLDLGHWFFHRLGRQSLDIGLLDNWILKKKKKLIDTGF